MRSALRSLWREPSAPDNPGTVWWDWWVVGALVVIALAEGILRDDVVWRPLAIVLALALVATLPWRRSHPLWVTAITFGAITVMNVVAMIRSDASFGLYTMAFILLIPYAVVRWGSGHQIVIGLGVILVGFVTGIVADWSDPGEGIAAFVFAMSPALIGAVVRYRSHARQRDQERLALAERELLARELHDTVAHHVSAIAIQSQVGQTLAAGDADAPLQALRIIEQEASRTLAEMRAMVGALRQGDDVELAPLPGMADIARLARGVGGTTPVRVDVTGDLDGVTPAVDAAVYRIVQESITNALRHARRPTTIDVVVEGRDRMVEVTVRDDGDVVAAGTVEAGFGLEGMRERATLLGGTFSAGPAPERGWRVSAVIPKDGRRR